MKLILFEDDIDEGGDTSDTMLRGLGSVGGLASAASLAPIEI